MPKIRKPPPTGILDHLIQRYREGRIEAADFVELKHWLESDPTVPDGKWYKRFKRFTLAGKGAVVFTDRPVPFRPRLCSVARREKFFYSQSRLQLTAKETISSGAFPST